MATNGVRVIGAGITKAEIDLDTERGTEVDANDTSFGPYTDDWDQFVTDRDELWTPDDMAGMLRRDGKARTLEQILTLPTRSAPLTVKPAKGSAHTDRVSGAITELLAQLDDPIEHTVGLCTGAYVYRRAYFEKVYHRFGDMYGYSRLAWRPQGSCRVKRDKRQYSRVLGFRQQIAAPVTGGQPKDTYKDILFPYAWIYTHGTHRDPVHGMSDFDVVWQCYRTKEKLRYLWYSFLEQQALPRTVVKGQNFDNAKKAAQAIARLKNGGIAAVTANWVDEIETIDSSGKGAAEFKEALRWLNQEAAGSVLAGFTELPNADSGNGSYALSKDQTDFFLQMHKGYAKELAHSVQTGVVADLVRLNFGVDEAVPRVEIGPLQREDISSALSLVQSLAVAPSMQVPREFLDLLTVKVAEALDLDVDKLVEAQRKHLEQAQAQATSPQQAQVAQVAAPADALVKAAQQAQAQQRGA